VWPILQFWGFNTLITFNILPAPYARLSNRIRRKTVVEKIYSFVKASKYEIHHDEFLLPYVTSSLLGPNILLDAPFSEARPLS
jgi:hypothetical protein